jgi:hypothetical protein
VREPDALGGGDAVNPDECKDWPGIEVKIGPGGAMTGKTSFVDFAPSGVEMAVASRLRLEPVSRKERIAGAAYRAVVLDTLTPSYLVDLWLRGLLSRACLDDMSEAELVSMRTHTKNRTFEIRLANDETGRCAARRLDELTAYMRRRFPRRGSTPPCEAVCV